MAESNALDDHGFVKLYDGGNEHICRHVWSARPINDQHRTSTPPKRVARTIRDALDAAEVEADGGLLDFMPVDKLGHIINETSILHLLHQLDSCYQMPANEKQTLAADICQSNGTDRCSCRKLVATLIKIGQEDDIPSMVREGFRDDSLPLWRSDKCSTMRHRTTHAICRTMDRWDNRKRREFWRTSNQYNAPYFVRPQTRGIYHYVLHEGVTLPFMREDTEFQEDEDNSRNPNPDPETVGDGGGFSMVRRVKIHPGHHQFGDYGIPSQDNIFAIKSLYTKRERDFEDEVSVLLRFTHRTDKQLAKLLATYEVRTERDVTYHLIFPWADWSVRTLWKQCPSVDRRNPSRLQWIARQSVAVVESLTFIHEEYANGLDPNNRERWGRHGDIKAENFLVYKDSSEAITMGLIFMADFGLSRFHRQESRSMVHPSAASPSYRPPEFDIPGGTLSRKSDIWSLGAFFLEFLTWYLKGWTCVESDFPDFRYEEDHQRINSDIYFRIENPGSSQSVIVKPQVTEWILRLHLHPDCTHFVHDLLDLIEDEMLNVDKDVRIGAKDLHTKLVSMNERCNSDWNYCMGRCACGRTRA
ncbi:hypothetical protein QQZ08_006157 [Neonectria magnoliae]|uniref:Protein kinase domain-containing protein n=1 Tax=Neonectria magnoliae TaxID=2732573 RepID=A0ABR1I1I9_9HYPO